MKHDEAKDVRLLSKIAKINQSNKTITIPKNAIIGNKRWGRLDYLCHYCGYHLVRPDGAIVNNSPSVEKESSKKAKQEERQAIARKRKQDKYIMR